MGKYTQIPQDTFNDLQLDAGILLYDFDIEAASAGTGQSGFDEEDFICATTGGITAECKPEYSDLAEDVDNAPVNLKEFLHLDGWTCTIEFTSLSNDPKGIRLALGAADIDEEKNKVTPRRDVKQKDFADVWWVGDKANGGFVAVHLLNALSSEGFHYQQKKQEKALLMLRLQAMYQ